MTTQEQVQPATQNETNANPAVSQTDGQSSEDVKPAGENTTAGDSTSASETPTEPEAPKNAAKIGENEYPTVADAIAAADGRESVVLLRDVTENIKINKSLTLDLGGFYADGRRRCGSYDHFR